MAQHGPAQQWELLWVVWCQTPPSSCTPPLLPSLPQKVHSPGLGEIPWEWGDDNRTKTEGVLYLSPGWEPCREPCRVPWP